MSVFEEIFLSESYTFPHAENIDVEYQDSVISNTEGSSISQSINKEKASVSNTQDVESMLSNDIMPTNLIIKIEDPRYNLGLDVDESYTLSLNKVWKNDDDLLDWGNDNLSEEDNIWPRSYWLKNNIVIT